MAAIIMGIAAGTVCYACVAFKNARKWDDALDVWGIHGMGGLTGAILTGTLASPHIWDTGDGIGAWTGTPEGMETQAISIIAAVISIGYAFGVTIVILKVMDAVWPGGIRVTPKEEEIGLDLAQHGERAYVNEYKKTLFSSFYLIISYTVCKEFSYKLFWTMYTNVIYLPLNFLSKTC